MGQVRMLYLTQGDYAKLIAIAAPIERIPLFVRSGCLLPLAAPVACVARGTTFEITVQ